MHDRFRVDRKGRGSWSRVIGNLESLHAASPLYFRDHVSLSAVVMSDEYLGHIRTFFENSELLRHLNVMTSYPVYTPNRLIEDTTPAAEVERPCGHCALFRDCSAQLRYPAGLTGFLKGFFQRELYDIHYRRTGDGFNGGSGCGCKDKKGYSGTKTTQCGCSCGCYLPIDGAGSKSGVQGGSSQQKRRSA